jgi:CHAT domain-containing protein/tetratricopeptide (TPR) repeat protein
MMYRRLRTTLLGGSVLVTALLSVTPVQAATQLPDLFGVGRNSLGEACFAQFDKRDPVLVDPAFDRSYALNCRGSVASRKVGTIRVVDNRPDFVAAIEKTIECGAARTVDIAKIGKARARRCVDKSLGSATLVIDFVQGGNAVYGSAGSSLAGPLEQGLTIAAGMLAPSDANLSQVKPSFSSAELLAANGAVGEAVEGFNAEAVLRQGVRFNQQGLYTDASRLLNDAISRADSNIAPALLGQLQLEAGLADSNIEFFRPADARFARARELLAGTADPLVQRKLVSYEALHDINKRQFQSAIAKLDTLARQPGSTEAPLSDPMTVASINVAPKARDGTNVTSIGGDDRQILQQQFVDALIDWARSTALLALGQDQLAFQRIQTARNAFAVVKSGRIDTGQALWLEARIERQAGRIAARRGDWSSAVNSFNNALSVLREAQSRNPGLGTSDLASAMIERADILARQGAPRDTVIAEFGKALDAVEESGNLGSVDRTAIDRYLALVANGETGTSDPDMVERLFRAVQLTQDPALARQVAQIQSVVSIDVTLASQFRERSDLAKELTAIRYQITQGTAGDLVAAEKRRGDMEKRLAELDTALAANPRFRATDDRPTSVKDIRDALGDGEVYFKLTTLRRGVYGLAISKDSALIYRAKGNANDLNKIATDLRTSVLPRESWNGALTLPRFSVGRANVLFDALAGPAAPLLSAAKQIVVDPTGPLQTVPIGILVTSKDSVEAFVARSRESKVSYENVAFLARSAEISTSLSPRQFVISRAQAGSSAPGAFIGFGDHALPTAQLLNAITPFSTATGCTVEGQILADGYYAPQFQPISGEELTIAARQLGATGAPIVTGDAFSDEAITGRKDLNQYRVLHFATHGFTEGNWLGCDKSPPSLLTSLPSETSDGVLTIDEIAGLNLDANLVFLAACDTAAGVKDKELARASGQEETGSSLEGLVRAFLTANARAVMATSWVAPNTPGTLRLVDTFYAKGRASNIGAALREGQLIGNLTAAQTSAKPVAQQLAQAK